MTRLLITLIVSLLGMSSNANATTFPGQRAANNPTLNELVSMGESYWHARGVSPCAKPTIYLVNDLGMAGETGDPADARTQGCDMWFVSSPDYSPLGEVQSDPRDTDEAANLCDEVWHELGHSANLTFPDNQSDPQHSSDPDNLMYADGGPPPKGCVKWANDRAKRFIKRKRRN